MYDSCVGSHAWLLLIGSVLGCGDDGGATTRIDAAADAPIADDAAEPPLLVIAPPMAPSPPVLLPCPAGWREVAQGDVTICEPWPESGWASCTGETVHLPGRPGCEPIGTECPADGWPEGLPADRPIVWVLSGAVGGDGTRELPFGTIAEAGTPAPGTIIAVGRGTYSERVRIGAGVTVWGACPSETVLTHTVDDRSAVVTYGAGAAMQNLTIRDSAYVGVLVNGASAELALSNVLIDGSVNGGIAVIGGGTLAAQRVVVRATRPLADQTAGIGIYVSEGGSAALVESAVLGNLLAGVVSTGTGVSVRLEGSLIADTESQMSDGSAGMGFQVEASATAVLVNSVLERNHFAGVSARTGGSATVEGCVVRSQRSETATTTHGMGVASFDTGRIVARRMLIDDNRGSGASAHDPGSTLELEDAVIRDTRGRERDDNAGSGLHVQMGATASIRRARVARNRSHGLVATSGGMLVAEDVVVSDTAVAAGDGQFGRGVACATGATCTLARLILERSAGTGLSAIEDGTSIVAEDVAIVDTGASGGAPARGVNIQSGASADLSRVSVTGSTEAGVVVLASSRLTAVDIAIRDPRPAGLNTGRGLDVHLGSTADVRNLLVENSHQFGISALESEVTVAHAAVTGTRALTCAGALCEQFAAGTAVASLRGSAMTVDDFVIRDAELCGAHVAGASTLDLRNGLVTGASIGACIQVDGYDITRLMQDVIYRDNDANLDATTLPVPDPLVPTGTDG